MSQTASSPAYPVAAGAIGAQGRVVALIDRWIYVFMAGLFVVTALLGFVPDSFGVVARIRAGQLPPFPPILHVHAVLMGSWLLLLLAQTSLVATRRPALHQKLGMAAFALVPAIVVAGLLLVPTIYREAWAAAHAPGAPAAARAAAATVLSTILTPLVLAQIRTGILFPTLIGVALLARRADPGTHKRLMIMATLFPLQAGIDRLPLPHIYPATPLHLDLYYLLWLSPMFAWDLFRLGRVHRAYVVGLGGFLLLSIPMYLLWGSPWWIALVPRLMGV
jgi:hypothetical protein